MAETITVEVACATPEKQRIIAVRVVAGSSLREAVERSHVADEFPELNVMSAPLGVFGRKVAKPESTPVQHGERVEIYRPLIIDPKQARLDRAAKARKKDQ